MILHLLIATILPQNVMEFLSAEIIICACILRAFSTLLPTE